MEIITQYGTWFIALAMVFGLYMTWGIGANDVANAMGTSVGSGAITVKQAIIIAAVFEFAGAVLAGGHVTSTIRKGIIDADAISGQPELLVYGMLAALLAALAARGYRLEPAETPLELAARAGHALGLGERLDGWMLAYYRRRFGGGGAGSPGATGVAELLAVLEPGRDSVGAV